MKDKRKYTYNAFQPIKNMISQSFGELECKFDSLLQDCHSNLKELNRSLKATKDLIRYFDIKAELIETESGGTYIFSLKNPVEGKKASKELISILGDMKRIKTKRIVEVKENK